MEGNLEAIIGELVRELGRVEGRTRLMKLVYLVDLETARASGRPASGACWSSSAHGPFSSDVLEALSRLDGVALQEWISMSPHGDPEYLYRPLDGARVSARPRLADPKLAARVKSVARRWGRRPLRQLMHHVYGTEPYRSTLPASRIELARASVR